MNSGIPLEETLTELFDTNSNPQEMLFLPEDYKNVPGWASLEFYLRGSLEITHERAIETFRRFYNFYLKRFPVHYFTEKSLPEVEFAFFFPVKSFLPGANPQYLVAIGEKNKRIVLFHKSLLSNLKTRENFYRVTKKWMGNGLPSHKPNNYNIEDILNICEKPDELLALRQQKFSRFLDRLQRKLKKTRLDRYFEGKWDNIRTFLENRDRHYMYMIAEKIKSEHISFEVARVVASVSENNLELYNWIMAGKDETAIRNRLQVTPCFPWLARAMSHEGLAKKYLQIEQIIDDGRPLIEGLQDFWEENFSIKIHQSAIRKTMDLNISKEILEPRILGRLLKEIGDHLPYLSLESQSLERLYEGEKNTWGICDYLKVSFAQILSQYSSAQREEILTSHHAEYLKILHKINDTRDYIQEIYNRVTLPYFAHKAHVKGHDGLSQDIQREMRDLVDPRSFIERNESGEKQRPYFRPFGAMAFHNIVRLSVLWHESIDAYNKRWWIASLDNDISWASLTGQIKAPNGVEIIPRNSKGGLRDEAVKMNHCIAGYTDRCLGLFEVPGKPREYSHIVHLKGHDGGTATFEILEPFYKTDGWTLKVGPMERPRIIKDVSYLVAESSSLYKAGQWYVDAINKGEITVNWDYIIASRAKHSSVKLSQISGFDVTDRNKCMDNFMAIRPYLPERQRRWSYDEWVERMGFRAEADSLLSGNQDRLNIRDFRALDFV